MISFFDVKYRLLHFGIDSTEDENMIGFIIEKVQADIKNVCNLVDIPCELYHKWTDMVCGEYLQTKKNSNQDIGIDFDSAVSAISEGDTKIEFGLSKGLMTNEQRINLIIDVLLDKSDLLAFRRISW